MAVATFGAVTNGFFAGKSFVYTKWVEADGKFQVTGKVTEAIDSADAKWGVKQKTTGAWEKTKEFEQKNQIVNKTTGAIHTVAGGVVKGLDWIAAKVHGVGSNLGETAEAYQQTAPPATGVGESNI